MKKIKMSCLSIELTRRCNLKCSHCFKGDAQNIDISAHHIEKMLGMIDEIYTVHITGGEPSLNLDGMRMLIDCIKKNQIAVHRLNVICNGIADTTERFFTMLDELNKIVLQPKDTRITISCDPYHSATGKISVLYLFEGWDAVKKLNKKEYSFKVLPYFTCCYPPIVSMGNGASNQSFANPDNPDEYGVLYNHPVNIYDNVIKHISIHANGIIGRDLNISYHDADNKKYQICHIDDISTPEDLIESVRLWNERTDVKIRGILFDIASRIYSPVCKSCPNYSKVYQKRLQLLKQTVDSEEINLYPAIFKESRFLDNLKKVTENIDTSNKITLSDAMECEWWNFTCWKR